MRRILTGGRGMTIPEIVIAIAVIGIGLVALSSAIPLAAYGIQEGNQLSTATFLANQRMEQVRNARWEAAQPPCSPTPTVLAVDKLGISAGSTSAPVGDGGATTFPDETPSVNPIPGFANYTRTVRIYSAAPACPGNDYGLRQVTVTVSYRPMTGFGLAPATTAKSATVTMYIAQR